MNVILAEAAESVRLIDALAAPGARDLLAVDGGSRGTADGGEARPGHARGSDADRPRSGLGWAESSRGESLAWIELDPAGCISRARLRPAAVRNWRGFDDACRSQNVFTDIPIIEASFWLTVAGTAR